MQQRLAALRWFFVQWEVRSLSPHWLVRAEAKWSLCWFWARNRSLCLFFFFGSLGRCFPEPPGNKKRKRKKWLFLLSLLPTVVRFSKETILCSRQPHIKVLKFDVASAAPKRCPFKAGQLHGLRYCGVHLSREPLIQTTSHSTLHSLGSSAIHPAKCEADRMNGCSDRRTEIPCIYSKMWSVSTKAGLPAEQSGQLPWGHRTI